MSGLSDVHKHVACYIDNGFAIGWPIWNVDATYIAYHISNDDRYCRWWDVECTWFSVQWYRRGIAVPSLSEMVRLFVDVNVLNRKLHLLHKLYIFVLLNMITWSVISCIGVYSSKVVYPPSRGIKHTKMSCAIVNWLPSYLVLQNHHFNDVHFRWALNKKGNTSYKLISINVIISITTCWGKYWSFHNIRINTDNQFILSIRRSDKESIVNTKKDLIVMWEQYRLI